MSEIISNSTVDNGTVSITNSERAIVEDTTLVFPEPESEDVSNLPKSLIILKNSIIEGRVPTRGNLEVGELALGLFKGQESIWSKNSSGEVVNLRSPRHDLMWGDLFKKYNTKEDFEVDLKSGIILETSIVFIEETKQLWTDNNFYGCELTWEDIENFILSQVVVFPIGLTELIDKYDENNEEPYSHELISQVFKGKVNFIRLIRNLNKKPYVTSLRINDGVVPITTISKDDTTNKIYELKLEYYLSNTYIKVDIKLENDIFTITKECINLSEIKGNLENINDRLDTLEKNTLIAENIKWTDVIDQ